MTAAVRVHREVAPRRDRTRPYTVLLDGRQVGLLRPGQTIDVPTKPGPHTLRIKVDWTGSPDVPFITEDATAAFVCHPNGSVRDAVRQLIPSLFNRTNWVVLRPY